MLRTLKKATQLEQEQYMHRIGSVQQAIPVRRVFEDGIFLLNNGTYSATYRFSDINYAVSGKKEQERMLLSYCEVLNGVEIGQMAQINVVSRKISKELFDRVLYREHVGDGLDKYRTEQNKYIKGLIESGNGIIQELYITLTTRKKNLQEARQHFTRSSIELGARFNRLGSSFEPLDINERLRIFHDFYRTGHEPYFRFSMIESMKNGHSFKDAICPTSMRFVKDQFETERKCGRVLFLREYPSYIRDSIITDFCELERNMILSINFISIPTDEAVKEIELKRLGVETNIANFQRNQNRNNNFSAIIPYDLEQQRAETKEFLDDITLRDQRMMIATVSILHLADTPDQLDTDTETLQAIARNHMAQLSTLTHQQLDGINTTLPYGMNSIYSNRTLTTESMAAMMPFRALEIFDQFGIVYGINTVSKNPIVANRQKLQNGNGMVLGVSGSGKSFITKEEFLALVTRYGREAEFVIIDPESEWGNVTRSVNGEVIQISSYGNHHINAFDLEYDYDTKNPVAMKTEFILSLCQQAVMMSGHNLSAKERSLIDRCVRYVYKDYVKRGYRGDPPTLRDFRNTLLGQKEREAENLALMLEMWTDGSLNTFAQHTNVNTNSNIICYDILELGSTLMPVGMLVILDAIWNRVVRNRRKGIMTYIVVDEIYLLFKEQYSADFLYKLWKRARKYNAFVSGITQNVDDLLQSATARTMLSNSEFLILLNQSGSDREKLQALLNLSDTQLNHITDAETGSGLLRMGSALVPFKNNFPKNTELYRLMTTRPNEKL